jgi:UDP-N-acetylglucosamine--N-acetylmuramyl-(pentapeptide) pyrophosphoryl-undecaprenol N-acetylglucosamine transferase
MNVLLTGGGTGGHVYPALALVEALRREDPECRVLFVGSRAGMEASLIPAAGVSFAGLAIRPPRSGAVGRLLVSLASGGVACGQAVGVVARFRPSVIVATGGIAAAPAVMVGAALRIPIVVIEGNVLPGRVNRFLARFGRVIAVASDAAAEQVPAGRIVVTGLPVRREVYTASREEGLRLFGLDPRRRTVLALGGSQGAQRLNQAVEEAVDRLAHRSDIQVIHQIGRGWAGAAGVSESRTVGGVRYLRLPYLTQIGPAYASADLVLSRCGANALAEITACGRPALLVPYPHAAEDHQTKNARPLASAGAAVVIPDAALRGEVLAAQITGVLDAPGRLEDMASRARALGRPDAAERVAALVFGVCRRPAPAREVHG